jgi:hypothetical protein
LKRSGSGLRCEAQACSRFIRSKEVSGKGGGHDRFPGGGWMAGLLYGGLYENDAVQAAGAWSLNSPSA